MTDIYTKKLRIGQVDIHLETGRIARQADGAVIISQSETVVLVTVTADKQREKDLDFFPLTVEYRERAAAGGNIPGGFTRRETRPADHEILTSRLIDRSIRPLFPKDFNTETQVIATVLSADPSADPALLSIIGASAAIHLSNIPWTGPIIGARTALLNGKLEIFPDPQLLDTCSLTVTASVGKQGLVMLEGAAREALEQDLIDAIMYTEQNVNQALEELDAWCKKIGKEKLLIDPVETSEISELPTEIDDLFNESIKQLFGLPISKQERKQQYQQIVDDIIEQYDQAEEDEVISKTVKDTLANRYQSLIRELTIDRKSRIDGRKYDEIRPISIEVGWLPRTHGSAIFTRGETQAVVSCSLGTSRDEQIVETLYGIERKRFMLHYNFPPFSVGETRPIRGPGRREIGHGSLAGRALEQLIPAYNDFPYTIRVVSDITESNGSSSMATVCGGCLALIDAGVPLLKPVAGIAMGLIKEGDDIAVLSDILGDEDHFGDMDFKVTGTKDGITAVQMDNKLGSLPREVLEKALLQAKTGRLFILEIMSSAISGTSTEISPRAPRVMTYKIKQDRIRDLIGPGGKTIQDLQQQTNSKVEVDDSGQVRIYASDGESAIQTLKQIKYLTDDIEVGKVYRGKVVGVKNFGVFVNINPHAEGLVHVSELDQNKVDNPADVVTVGDEMIVRVLGVDERGKIKLSRKDALSYNPDELGFE